MDDSIEMQAMQERVKDLEASLATKRELIKCLDTEIDRLKAENKILNPCNHTGLESFVCEMCGYPDPRKLISKLKAEYADACSENESLLSELKSVNAELAAAKEKIVEIDDENGKLKEKLRALRARCERLEAERDRM